MRSLLWSGTLGNVGLDFFLFVSNGTERLALVRRMEVFTDSCWCGEYDSSLRCFRSPQRVVFAILSCEGWFLVELKC